MTTAASTNPPLGDQGQEKSEVGRSRVRQIFRFLKDFNGIRNPVKRQISEQPWLMWFRDLPKHPFVEVRNRTNEPGTDDAEATAVVLRVRRPKIPSAPSVPGVLEGWLPANWKDPSVLSIEPLRERRVTRPELSTVERFDALPERVQTFAWWATQRDGWANEALPAQLALSVFNRLYELHGRLEREGESAQLVLGQGVLYWQREDGDITHPVAIQRLQLTFDPSLPEFLVSETGQPPELLRPLLLATQEAAAQTIKQADEELAVQDIDLLDIRKIEGPLRRVAAALHSGGQFTATAPAALKEFPQVAFEPVLYLQRRNQGFAAALDFLLEDLSTQKNLPAALLRISGIEQPAPSESPADTARSSWEELPEILFTKEANEEQFQIADRLNRYSNVLVQGPPGTGKTHTIANLLGHLLAQGKRVLVTAHTSKALRVLRRNVVNPLQTLCVSVLDNETESRKQLEASVDEMIARLTSENPILLDRKANSLDCERRNLILELSTLRKDLMNARQDEFRDVIACGVGISPCEAARFVSKTAVRNGWIPGSVEPEAPAPLSDEEARELYSARARLGIDDERELRRWRPRPGEVPGGEEFGLECNSGRALQESDRRTGAEFWLDDARWDAHPEQLVDIESKLSVSITLLANAPLWKLDAVAAGINGVAQTLRVWTELVERLQALNAQFQSSLGQLLDRRCTLAVGIPADTQQSVANEISQFMEKGGVLSPFRVLTKPVWRKFIGSVTVNDAKPENAADFRALESFAALTAARQEFGIRWTNQIAARGGTRWEDYGKNPEEAAVLTAPMIRRLLSWRTESLEPLIQSLKSAGFKWDEFITEREVSPGEHMELRRLLDALVDSLPKMLAARVNALQLDALERKFRNWNRALFSPDKNLLPATPVLDLRLAVTGKDYLAYDLAYRRLSELHALAPLLDRYGFLLGRLRHFAPEWANAIDNRLAPHDTSEPPALPREAWKWRQYRQELDRRSAVSIPDIQKRVHELDAQLRRVTARLIEVRSWSAQCKRVGLEEQQALQGWKDINRRIGRGTGGRVPGLRAEARRTLVQARNAVPVWIMPLSRVAETFDPRTVRFDVVIIDEASQCDVMGLLALYLADQAVVVGDHEQVSPAAVGQEIGEVEHLISQHLIGIPNSKLYDGKMSLYDLARQSFGGMIRLLEHFRCVPEIISFSNELSYGGAIKPLRDATGTNIKPSVVAYRVAGTRTKGKINGQEARTIVSLLQAAIEQPEYEGKTFGAISLLGEEQAVEIERLAREMLSPSQLSVVQFLCGTAAQFQGDERDVVFLSMVDSPDDDGLLRMRQEDLFRQRFNVAASRPKDQLWVIHSLDPKRNLKPGDLRRRLIEHAENPNALREERGAKSSRTESEFEKLVMERLVREGYRVHPQYNVGHYRIDLVVEGDQGRRLAVECDGDRFHPIEKIAEDMARQAVLERIGWRFARIRGSLFFREPDAAMSAVFERLSQLLILPLGPEQSNAEQSSSSELLERVKRRAAEIVHGWDNEIAP